MLTRLIRFLLPEFQVIHLFVRFFSFRLKVMPVKVDIQVPEVEPPRDPSTTMRNSKANRGRVIDA